MTEDDDNYEMHSPGKGEPGYRSPLLPCPFCGGKAARPDGASHTWCTEVSCGSDAYLSVAAWNSRPGPEVKFKPEMRERVLRAIFDPGLTEGERGDRDLASWQTDAVMSVLAFTVLSEEVEVQNDQRS